MVRKMSSRQVLVVAGVNHETPRILSSSGEQLRGLLEADVARKARFRLNGSSSSKGLEVGVVPLFLEGPATTSISESELVKLVLAEDGPECCCRSFRRSSLEGSDIFQTIRVFGFIFWRDNFSVFFISLTKQATAFSQKKLEILTKLKLNYFFLIN